MVFTTDVALQISVVVEVLFALVAARRTFRSTTYFLRTTSVFGRFEVEPQSARTVARELTDAAAAASVRLFALRMALSSAACAPNPCLVFWS